MIGTPTQSNFEGNRRRIFVMGSRPISFMCNLPIKTVKIIIITMTLQHLQSNLGLFNICKANFQHFIGKQCKPSVHVFFFFIIRKGRMGRIGFFWGSGGMLLPFSHQPIITLMLMDKEKTYHSKIWWKGYFIHTFISAAASSSAVPPISPIRTIPDMHKHYYLIVCTLISSLMFKMVSKFTTKC